MLRFKKTKRGIQIGYPVYHIIILFDYCLGVESSGAAITLPGICTRGL